MVLHSCDAFGDHVCWYPWGWVVAITRPPNSSCSCNPLPALCWRDSVVRWWHSLDEAWSWWWWCRPVILPPLPPKIEWWMLVPHLGELPTWLIVTFVHNCGVCNARPSWVVLSSPARSSPWPQIWPAVDPWRDSIGLLFISFVLGLVGLWLGCWPTWRHCHWMTGWVGWAVGILFVGSNSTWCCCFGWSRCFVVSVVPEGHSRISPSESPRYCSTWRSIPQSGPSTHPFAVSCGRSVLVIPCDLRGCPEFVSAVTAPAERNQYSFGGVELWYRRPPSFDR